MGATVEAKLKRLFDFQRFVQEPKLQKVIDDSMSFSNLRKLSDDDLDMVAAGTEINDNAKDDDLNKMPIHCSCGWDFEVKLGVKSAECPNPLCKKIHYFNG